MRRLADSVETSSETGRRTGGGPDRRTARRWLFSEKLACIRCGVSYPEITPRIFSFNSPHGACPACDGIGYAMTPGSSRRGGLHAARSLRGLPGREAQAGKSVGQDGQTIDCRSDASIGPGGCRVLRFVEIHRARTGDCPSHPERDSRAARVSRQRRSGLSDAGSGGGHIVRR